MKRRVVGKIFSVGYYYRGPVVCVEVMKTRDLFFSMVISTLANAMLHLSSGLVSCKD